MENAVKFQKNTFGKQMKSMLKADFRRMFKSKPFYILIACAPVLPVIIGIITGMAIFMIVKSNNRQQRKTDSISTFALTSKEACDIISFDCERKKYAEAQDRNGQKITVAVLPSCFRRKTKGLLTFIGGKDRDKDKKMKKHMIKEYIVITFGAVLAAAAIFFFMMPSHIVVGSGTALAMVLGNFIPIPVSVITLILNIFLLIMGFVLLGPEFGAKTVYAAMVLPVALGVFEFLLPDFKSLTEDPLLDTLCYILVVGAAMAILFSHNASSGGLDIVAKIMSKYLKMGLGTAVTVSGIAVALTSLFVYDTKTVVLSVLGTYFGGLILDKFIFGLNLKRRVCIISEHLDSIVDFVLYTLHSGATLYEGVGAFDNAQRREVVTIVDKHEYAKLMDYVKKIDPKAFVTVYSVNEVKYIPKSKKDKSKNLTASTSAQNN